MIACRLARCECEDKKPSWGGQRIGSDQLGYSLDLLKCPVSVGGRKLYPWPLEFQHHCVPLHHFLNSNRVGRLIDAPIWTIHCLELNSEAKVLWIRKSTEYICHLMIFPPEAKTRTPKISTLFLLNTLIQVISTETAGPGERQSQSVSDERSTGAAVGRGVLRQWLSSGSALDEGKEIRLKLMDERKN